MSDFVDHLLELMRPWSAVAARKMFGGHGLYRHGLMFALVADDELYVKIDDQTRPQFERAGLKPFVYDGKGKPIEMSYWTVPPECLESSAEMSEWCRLAYAAALRAKPGTKAAAEAGTRPGAKPDATPAAGKPARPRKAAPRKAATRKPAPRKTATRKAATRKR